MNIVVIGAGKVGYYLINTLLEHGHSVALVETSSQRCKRVAEEFDILTICGDATELLNLTSAGADRADAVLAVTGRDEVNLVCCQLAKRKLGVRRVLGRCNNPKNRVVFHKLGIELAVSATALIADLIEREIVSEHMRTLLTFHHGELTLIEMHISAGAPAVAKRVVDLAPELPEGCVLVSVVRKDQVVIPRGNTVIHVGDSIMALTHAGAEDQLRNALLGKE